jgi:hypothetical protein
MKGLIVNCKTGEIKKIDDGLPMPKSASIPEPEFIDLAVIAKKLDETDELKAKVSDLEKAISKTKENNNPEA